VLPEPEIRVEHAEAQALERLEPEWWELWRRSRDATPFQSPAWLLPWWRCFGEGRPVVATVRRQGRLDGLAASYIHGFGQGAKLLPLGVGISDYLDPILNVADGPAVLAALARQGASVNRIDLEGQPDGSALLTGPSPQGWHDSVQEREPAPVILLENGPPRAAASRLGKQTYYERRLRRLGSAAWVDADHGNLDELLDGLFALHAARWKTRGEPGVLADPRVQSFHRQAAPELLQAELLCLFGLRVEERLAAVFYGLKDRHRLLAYLGGYDPAVPHPGLGAMTIGRALGFACAWGLREFHFLRGRERYKYDWGAIDRPLFARCLRK
jgi:CelD/BcsL family acetyltransferase involved in cellulose biosynthesis